MDLTCYVMDGWDPRIRPASSKRAWMEATPERFAYRCLPLAIANAHGWEMLSPCGFEARWNGGPMPEDVEIRLDAGAAVRNPPVPLFGQATLTFHIEGLFRTPPGWNLWVGGSPNSAKDGIAPLGGIIETDWSPYSFTMNWRFTRADHWVRFEENEPICFFFPVERARIERIEPRILPLDENPELSAAFLSWSASRDAFHQWVRETNPTAPADKWQKLYYRGLNPDGSEGAADHQAKLRVPEFGCPHGWTSRAAGAPATLAEPAAKPEARSNGSGGHDPEDALALARSRWIASVGERQRALAAPAGGIAEVEGITREQFLERFYAPGRPAILRGALRDWPALERWTPDYLKRKVGAAPVEYQGNRGRNPDFELAKDAHKQTMAFDAFIDQITAREGNESYVTAYNDRCNGAAFAPLHADLGQLDMLTPANGMLWIGPGGTFTPLHFDLTNNLLAQIVGTKYLVVLPPSETPRLANRRHVFSDVHDITDPERLERYPLAEAAIQHEVELNPGDALFIPVGWWHQVVSAEFSVMLTYTNFLWPNDASASFPFEATAR